MKVAKLVKISLMTRVIVEDTASEIEIIEASKPNFINKIREEVYENLEEIIDDEECPYDPTFDEL